MIDLETLAETIGVTIQYDTWNLSEHPNLGYYLHTPGIILLHTSLHGLAARCVLAHELGHAHYGHECLGDSVMTNRFERRADIYAARLLIDEDAYRQADIMYEGDIRGIAHELEVTQHLVTVWREYYRQSHPVPVCEW